MSQWQLELKQAIKSYEELFKLIKLDASYIQKLGTLTNSHFPLMVTLSYIKRIKPNDPKDPLLLQILPYSIANNLEIISNSYNYDSGDPSLAPVLSNTSNGTASYNKIISNQYSHDPLQEKKFNVLPGLIHKYHGRVLLLTTQGCAIHCQYCFRQHFPFSDNLASNNHLSAIVEYIAANPEIEEVILSGGDPLLVSNKSIEKLFNILSAISSVKTIRIHSRIPIVLPTRLEPELLKILVKSRFNIVLVTHANHPNELNQEVYKYIKKLHKTKIILLNQTVMLKNVNDNPVVLAKLSKKLFEFKILPYYMHTLDPVLGTEGFALDLAKTKQIFRELISMLPGYLVPKLVTEIPGATSKTLVNFSNAKHNN